MYDLKAFEAYASYFYYFSKLWTRPLPQDYDPQQVAQYFSVRPHLVTLRVLEVLVLFHYFNTNPQSEILSTTLPFSFVSLTIRLSFKYLLEL